MEVLRDRQAMLILVLLLSGVMCNAAIVPFMSVYIVAGLGMEPWMISVYTACVIVVSLIANRQFGEFIDGGVKIAPLVLLCIAAHVFANGAILIFQTFWALVAIASICFGVSNAAVSTMYSFGRLYAQDAGLNIQSYNSYLRIMTSLGWMIAPMLSFSIASQFGYAMVFVFALGLAAIWCLLWWLAMPKHYSSKRKEQNTTVEQSKALNKSLMYAASACFFFALSHVLCTSALPLFYIREVGLPTYAPGLSLSVKTSVEIIGIFSAPWLINKVGARQVLLCTAGIAVVAFVVLSQVQTLPQMVFGAGLEGLYYGVFAGVGITFMQSFAGDRIARATSLYMNSLFLGGLVSGATLGLIAQVFDFKTAIQLSTLGALAAAFVLFVMPANQSQKA